MDDIVFFKNRADRLHYDKDGGYYVVEQYQKWFVRINDQKSAIVPAVPLRDKSGTIFKYENLEWDEGLKGYRLRRKKKNEEEYVAGRTGLLTLFDLSMPGIANPLSPSLYVGPKTISEQDFVAILDRLGQLAIAQASGLLAPVTVAQQVGTRMQGEGRTNHHLTVGQTFLDLARSVKDNWANILKYPAREIKLIPETIDLSMPRNQRSLKEIYQVIQKPGKRKHQTLVRQENSDTLENRFIAYVIRDILIRRGKVIGTILRNKAETFRSVYENRPMDSQGMGYVNLWRKRRGSMEQQADALESMAEQIEKSTNTVQAYLKEPLLKNIRNKSNVLSQTLAKVSSSKEYGPIYRVYQEYIRNQGHQTGGRPSKLIFALEERAIKLTSNLFELWAFLEIYAMLVSVFGFVPDGDNPLELAQVENGEILLAKEKRSYRLVFSPKVGWLEQPLCRITLTYAPKIKTPHCKPGKSCYSSICKSLPCYEEIHLNKNWLEGLTPDIYMIISTPTITRRFALDVKYRDYQSQRYSFSEEREKFGIESVFDLDLLVTAKMKYLNGLGMDGSFILHSDPNPEYTLFGGEPFKSPPHREAELSQEYYPAHQVGAVYISPSNLQNLEKLLKSFLMYHANLWDICWTCRNQLTEQNGGKNREKQPRWQGDYFQCTDCGQFWIKQVCGNGHKIIKLGSDSFHKTVLDNDWLCICPSCGDAPSFAERQ